MGSCHIGGKNELMDWVYVCVKVKVMTKEFCDCVVV